MLKYKETLNIQYKDINNIKNFSKCQRYNNGIRIYFENGKIDISYYEGDIVKVFIGEINEESIDTFAMNNILSIKIVQYKDEEEYIHIFGDTIHTYIHKESLKIIFKNINGEVICEDYEATGKRGENFFISKANDCIAYYGFGEKGGELNKKGYYLENYNTDDASTNDQSTLFYKTIPFYIGIKEEQVYGIYLDNSCRSYFDMGKQNKEKVFFGAEQGQIQYYFIPGNDVKEVVKNYCSITGFMDMPPMWSLGYQQCRYSYNSEDEVRELSEKFREKQIPCDAIYLDIDYMDQYKVMTFNKNTYPSPSQMCHSLKSKGFNIITIVDPGVKVEKGYEVYERGLQGNHYVQNPDGSTFIGEVWAGESAFPDFSKEDCRKWWKDELKEFISQGISGIWNDMNEPSVFNNEYKSIPEDSLHNSDKGVIEHREFHNLYGMMMSKCAKEAQEELRENVRPFSMTRAAFAGTQRYTSIWTGDNQSTWEQLRMSIPMNCNLNLSGFPFVGNDVGGFLGDCKDELFIRWMELGAFLPIFRNHSAINTRRQEPWSFGKKAEDIVKKSINLRYRLLPYIYNEVYKAHTEGIGVFRPMIMEYPKDVNVINMYSQFMFGDDFLIAPVLYEGVRKKLVYLPKGKWYDYFTHKEYEGGRYYTIKIPIDTIGVFVKEGSIIPIYEEHYNYVGEKEMDVTLEVFKGQGNMKYYEDDGITREYKNGKYNLYNITSVNNKEVQEVKVDIESKGLSNVCKFKIKYV